jgi:hypothetical protein
MRLILLNLLKTVFFTSILFSWGCNTQKTKFPGKIDKLSCSIPKELKKSGEKIKVIGVFTTWSLKSQVMMKRFNKLNALLKGKKIGFAFIFIDKDQRMVDGWYKAYKPDFTVLHDPKFKLCSEKVNKVPLFIIMKSSGKICYLLESVISSKTMFKMVRDAMENCN